MRAVRLRTEYLTNPCPLDITRPRFYWNCEGGARQSAYRIVATRDGEEVWDSGKVDTSAMTHIRYEGKPLRSRDHVEWKVCLWDENGVSGEWSEAWFEMGLLDRKDWKARWISGDYEPKKNQRYPVDCFRKTFRLPQKAVRARLYITACGIYEACINGQRVGEFYFAPGCTDYRKRIQYQAYDVTGLLREKNELTVWLADGWFRGSDGCFGKTNVFGRRTKLLYQLEVTTEDGKKHRLCSDDTTEWSSDGPIRFADLQDGEIYDASRRPSYGGKAVLAEESVVPTASDNVEPKCQETFTPKLIRTPSGKQVLDFGQNIAGIVAFRVKGEKGQKLRLTFGEILDERGEFTQENFMQYKPKKEYGKLVEMIVCMNAITKTKIKTVPTPLQKLEFICSGREDTYRMRFAVMGFRYALVETDIAIDPQDFRGVAVYSDMERTGTFACSNELVNRLFLNALWSMKGNYLDVPTDCPTRERMAWTGDAQIFFKTAAYCMDVASFMRKWMRDIRDDQFASGKSSAVVPYQGCSQLYDNTGASVGFGDALVLIPYRYWKIYNDDAFLRENYGMMRAYAMFMIKNAGPRKPKEYQGKPWAKYLYEKGVHLGEWLEPEEFRDQKQGMGEVRTEEATAYMHYSMRCMSEVARALGETEDAALFEEYARGAKTAYQALFLSERTVDTDRQAKLVRPLALGLTEDNPADRWPGETRERMQERLVEAVKNRGYLVGTGFLSTAFLLPELCKGKRSDVAYRMLENEEAPGWLAEVKAGATTIWEDWEGKLSHNHYSPGTVCEWLFSGVGGIQVDGENHFVIAPVCGGTLTWAEVSYKSLYGKVTVSWKKEGENWKIRVSLPPNTTADIRLPEHGILEEAPEDAQ